MKKQRISSANDSHSFWRAANFLRPYWAMVVISICCAVFVAAAGTAGLGTLLPMMHVLTNHDTVPDWANREIAQKRLGATLADNVNEVRIIKHDPDKAAAGANIADYDALTLVGAPPGQPGASQLLRTLSDPAVGPTLDILANGQPRQITLPPVPRYLQIGRAVAGSFPTHPVKAIAAAFGVIAALAILSNFVKFFQEYLSDKAAILAVNDIRRRLYDHVLHVPLSHFNLSGSSDVTSRLVQDAQGLNDGFKTVLGQSIQEPVKAAMAFGLALWLSWKLTLFIILFAPLMLAIIKKFGKKMRHASKKLLANSSVMLGQIDGSLAGIRVVKGASAERFERRRYTAIMDQLVVQSLRMSRIDSFSEPTVETLTLFVVGIVVLVASYMLFVSHSLKVAPFFLIMACLASIGDSLRRVSKVNNVLQRAGAAATRIFEVLDLPMERTRRDAMLTNDAASEGGINGNGRTNGSINSRADGANGSAIVDGVASAAPQPRIKLPPLRSEVRFEHLTFAYPGTTTPAIEDVNLTVPKGQCVAVVGRNGSGKTTLLALLPRFYHPQQGRILIDGVDIRYATMRSLRRQISIVTQDSVIFPGTVSENIAYGQPVIDQAEVENAARRAFAHDFIMEKPQGYGTRLGGLGSQLSGGQKQRLCIARAIYRKAPILVLDEATSQVDAESEHLIQQAIDSLLHERTTFVIAHRFSTILSADTIVVMDRGHIVGQGSHEELLAGCPTYQQLYERQLLG